MYLEKEDGEIFFPIFPHISELGIQSYLLINNYNISLLMLIIPFIILQIANYKMFVRGNILKKEGN